MEGKAGDSAGANGTELTNFVQGLLQQMRSRWALLKTSREKLELAGSEGK